MALATEDEWESDPELRQMRKDFVASFEGRRIALEGARGCMSAPGAPFDAALGEAVAVAHKLAGAAETYGFPTLGRAAAAFEDWAQLTEQAARAPRLAAEWTALLARGLDEAARLGRDPVSIAEEGAFKTLLKASAALCGSN